MSEDARRRNPVGRRARLAGRGARHRPARPGHRCQPAFRLHRRHARAVRSCRVAPIASQIVDRRRPPLARLGACRRRPPRHRRPQGRARRRPPLHRRRQPRDPHAAQRHPRHGRAAGRERALAAQRDYAAAIRKSGARLLDLLNNVLDFSRMEAGDIPLDAAPFDPVRPRAGRRRTSRPARSRRRARHRRHRRSRPARAHDRRRRPPAPDPVQPRRQRHQVHRAAAPC